MPAIPLPENASLEHLKKQAKLVRQLAVDGDAGALELLGEFHPRFVGVAPPTAPDGITLADAQLVVARLYGYPSWAKLRSHLRMATELTRPDPGDDEDADDDVDRFVSLACVSYNGGHDPLERIDAARAMARQQPELLRASVAAVAVSGDHEAMARHLSEDPSIIEAPCGPHRWPPLLYCCYSRLDDIDTDTDTERSTVATAQVLLDAGADLNAGFLWRGLVPPFTALTGAFGGGEADQPPHRDALAMARSLLVAGADPNDGQALYNHGLAGSARDDTTHLELLVEFGLGASQDGPWYQRFGSRLTPPVELLYDELEIAAHRGLASRMRFLTGLGLDLSRPVGRSSQTPWQLATDAEHDDVLAVLARAGVHHSEER